MDFHGSADDCVTLGITRVVALNLLHLLNLWALFFGLWNKATLCGTK